MNVNVLTPWKYTPNRTFEYTRRQAVRWDTIITRTVSRRKGLWINGMQRGLPLVTYASAKEAMDAYDVVLRDEGYYLF